MWKIKVVDVMASGEIKERASVFPSKTTKPVRFEISEGTRASLTRWMREPLMIGSEYLWPGRFHERLHISTRQNARIVREWVTSIGQEPSAYGTHSMRRTKVTNLQENRQPAGSPTVVGPYQDGQHPKQIEAVRATGAGSAQVLVYGVVPLVMPALWGISVFRWDSNIRESTILGLVGAGSFGLKLNASMAVLAWDPVTVILLLILKTVVVSEWISAVIRRAII